MDKLQELANETDIVPVLQSHRLTYVDDVTCMGTERHPHVLLHGYANDHRLEGRPKKKWPDNIHEDCTDMDIVPGTSLINWL